MVKVVDISEDTAMIKKLYKFFKEDTIAEMPNLKRYLFYVNLGKVYALLDGKKIIGGLALTTNKVYTTVINYYVPTEHSNTSVSLRLLELLLAYKDATKKEMFLRSKDVSTYHRFVKHIGGDVYQLLLPTERF